MSRQVQDLRWARPSQRPPGIPLSRPRGAKALGLAYEKQLEVELGTKAQRGCWFEFVDRNGHGWCQTDFLIEGLGCLVVLECKHTWTSEAFRQLNGLYLPVVGLALARPVVGLQVCKNLVSGLSSCVVGNLERGVELAGLGREVCWHWLGRPLPRPRNAPRRRAHQSRLDALAELL